jgi:hypothetical protein
MDPRREAARLIGTLLGEGTTAEGCLVFFGLGGGYPLQAALAREDVHRLIVVDFCAEGVAELLAAADYRPLFADPRVTLLVDPAPGELEAELLRLWQPGLEGGIRVIPLRSRVEHDEAAFSRASREVKAAITRVSADYSAQAWFGTRWFSNIIRNVLQIDEAPPLPPVSRAAICAAGPSLEDQLPRLAERRADYTLISVDTALPALRGAGLTPDAVISIDCQHISYHHFMEPLLPGVPLFLDLSSPPLLASRGGAPVFFAGGHPLARYLSRYWRPFPELDTSGGNVTSAACSLAEYLGAREIMFFGADFSYPRGKTYARGTYLYPWFERRQSRFAPLEAQAAALLYRSGPPEKRGADDNWYYETAVLKSYREGLEAAATRMTVRIRAAKGRGAPLHFPDGPENGNPQNANLRNAGLRTTERGIVPAFPVKSGGGLSAERFLINYRSAVASLPRPAGNMARYVRSLGEEQRQVLTTLLPALAALKRREPDRDGGRALEAARDYALKELDAVITT